MNHLLRKKCALIGYLPLQEENHQHCVKIKERLHSEILSLIQQGYVSFYSGLELGIEMWGGEIILALKETYSDLKLLPFLADENRADDWDEKLRYRYFDEILPKSEPALYVDYQPQVDSMLQRDQLMIQRSQVVLLVHQGEPLELRMAYNLKFAKEQKCHIISIDTSKLCGI